VLNLTLTFSTDLISHLYSQCNLLSLHNHCERNAFVCSSLKRYNVVSLKLIVGTIGVTRTQLAWCGVLRSRLETLMGSLHIIVCMVYRASPCMLTFKSLYLALHCNHSHYNLCYINPYWSKRRIYEACPESKDTKVLNMHNIFNLQKRHCETIACI
jgi:hypothetical protein